MSCECTVGIVDASHLSLLHRNPVNGDFVFWNTCEPTLCAADSTTMKTTKNNRWVTSCIANCADWPSRSKERKIGLDYRAVHFRPLSIIPQVLKSIVISTVRCFCVVQKQKGVAGAMIEGYGQEADCPASCRCKTARDRFRSCSFST